VNAPLDPGLQVERTGLAWVRTALGLAANAFLVLRSGIGARDGTTIGAGIALLALGAIVAMVGWRRPLQLDVAVRSGRTPVNVRVIRATAVAVGLAAVAALLAVLR